MSTTTASVTPLPQGFVYLENVCSEIIQHLKYATADNFTGAIVDGYCCNKVILTAEAANTDASSGSFLRWKLEEDIPEIKQKYYPTLSKLDLFEKLFIAPGNSGHSRGSTVDITLASVETGQPLDMGTGFDYFGDLAHFSDSGISSQAKKNRLTLKKLMDEYGFDNYANEWWHYTLRDEPFPNQYFNFIIQ